MQQQQQVPSPTADEDDIEEIYRRLRQQQQEIGVLTSAGDRLRAESAATRERFRKYEEELNKKVRAAREAAKEAKEELGRCEEEVELRGVRIVSLERELGLCNARLSHLEIELNLIRPDLQRLAECERIIENLSTRLMNRESKGSDITAEMAQRSFEMQISLEAAIQELHLANGMLKEKVWLCNELHAQSEEMERRTVENAAKIEAQAKAYDKLRESSNVKIAAVEAKCTTLRRINVALESRIMELESQLRG